MCASDLGYRSVVGGDMHAINSPICKGLLYRPCDQGLSSQ
jgi:hypothetical protein